MNVHSSLRPAIVVFVGLTLVTGVAYPLAITGVGRALFPAQAAGSFVEDGDRVVGSSLIGQPFSDPGHFWSRPSATAPQPDNAGASGGSNLGPSNPALVDAVKGRVAALKAADDAAGVTVSGPVPVDLVTASASGLDPHLSPAAAAYQAVRIAKVRGLPLERVRALIAEHTDGPQLGFLGMPRVNVLALNRALDAAAPETAPRPVAPTAPATPAARATPAASTAP